MNELKLIIAGGRDFNDYQMLISKLTTLADGIYADRAISIVSGMAHGADALGVRFAMENDVKLYEFPADWARYGKRAGFIRNEQMGNFADALLAFWDGESSGTRNMIHFMAASEKPYHVYHY